MRESVLGAVLAGGSATRFGSDKALAHYQGRPLVDHVIAALTAQTDAIVIVGRKHPGVESLPDRPAPGLGPLGGLNAALHHAADHGFTYVLAAGCDLPTVPGDLIARLGPAPVHALNQPTLGLWPADLAPALDAHLAAGHRSLRSWAAAVRARTANCGELPNINHPADLAALQKRAALQISDTLPAVAAMD